MTRPRKSGLKAKTARTPRARHRPHLIDACISALHLYGPSKTTVDKVVGIAGLSPGIVRFYFDSKDAMLVASLEFLANEFETRLIQPVTAQLDKPVAALERLVDLYLGPDLASARKVSVWYSFWGEASSRQEYYDICGARDAKFEALVHELVRRVLAREPVTTADSDAIALGLIGTLEVLWQTFAFQTEAAIDRHAARRRAGRYLSSVFPASFGAPPASAVAPSACGWQFAGRAADYREPGSALAIDTPTARLLVVRGDDLGLRAFDNRCPVRPHGLIERPELHRLERVSCAVHGATFGRDGKPERAGDTPPLNARQCAIADALVWVSTGTSEPVPALPPEMTADLSALEPNRQLTIAVAAEPAVVRDLLQAGTGSGWTSRMRLAVVKGAAAQTHWLNDRQRIGWGPEGLTVLEILPGDSNDCSEIRLWRYDRPGEARRVGALRYLDRRSLRSLTAMAVSTQRGLTLERRLRRAVPE